MNYGASRGRDCPSAGFEAFSCEVDGTNALGLSSELLFALELGLSFEPC